MTQTWSDIWIDAAGQRWNISIDDDRVTLDSDGVVIEVSHADWDRDIYVAAHGTGHIVRFATVESEIGFFLTEEQAAPLLRQMGRPIDAAPQIDVRIDDDIRQPPLLWPKVSPLAVWALMCSSLVFVPIVGLAPAIATIVLLICHRKAVRRVRAWNHSRALCKAAFLFLVVGLAVEALSMAGCMMNYAAEARYRRETDDAVPTLHAPDQPDRGSLTPASLTGEPDASLPGVTAGGTVSRSEAQRGRGVTVESTAWLRQTVPPDRFPDASFCWVGETSEALLAVKPFWERDIDWGMLVASLFVILISLSVHEAAHATTAWWLGDDFARRLGRVTINPLMHVDPVGTLMLPIVLFVAGFGAFGWAKPVPVMLGYVPRPRRAHILISIAGPGSNILLGLASFMLLLGLSSLVGIICPDANVSRLSDLAFKVGVEASGFPLASVFAAACTMLKLSFIINVVLAFFNMIPIPPLDGSWVLQHLFPFTIGRVFEVVRPYSFLLFLGLIYSGALEYLLLPVVFVIAPALILLSYATPF